MLQPTSVGQRSPLNAIPLLSTVSAVATLWHSAKMRNGEDIPCKGSNCIGTQAHSITEGSCAYQNKRWTQYGNYLCLHSSTAPMPMYSPLLIRLSLAVLRDSVLIREGDLLCSLHCGRCPRALSFQLPPNLIPLHAANGAFSPAIHKCRRFDETYVLWFLSLR